MPKDLNPLNSIKLFNSTLDATSTLNNAELTLLVPTNALNGGFFSLCVKFDSSSHTDARLSATFKVSPNGVELGKSESGNEVKLDMHEAGGVDSGGFYYVQFYVPVCVAFQISVIETASQDAVFQAWLVTQ